ncbi:MAG: hypothetical protein D6677_08925 [Calditrichaeota bacterium]|nr:MAG: hypothetical protein D6677_08925 [Calditrichota bacterium]
MKKKLLLLILIVVSMVYAGEKWFRLYKQGVEALQNGQYELAVQKLEAALAAKDRETKKIRTYGMHFIEYFPHRELGIAYYFLDKKKKALFHLKKSYKTEPTERARSYLKKLAGDYLDNPPPQKNMPPESKNAPVRAHASKLKLVGERMGIAVLPFENKGASRDLGNIVLDKMINALVNKGRFKVIERAQLEKILEEQQLGQSGIIDASTAAEIGKGLGVDAMVLGSVAVTPDGAASIDARLIDTESAKIILAHDAYARDKSVQTVKTAVQQLADDITTDLPLVQGFVIQTPQPGSLMLDMGSQSGLRKGVKCVIYKEGKEIRHPVSGEVLGKETIILGTAIITEVYDKYSNARIEGTPKGAITVGDRFVTK